MNALEEKLLLRDALTIDVNQSWFGPIFEFQAEVDGELVAIDLTGMSLKLESRISPDPSSEIVVSLSDDNGLIVDRAAGTSQPYLSPAETSLILYDGTFPVELELTDGAGDKFIAYRGALIVRRGVI